MSNSNQIDVLGYIAVKGSIQDKAFNNDTPELGTLCYSGLIV